MLALCVWAGLDYASAALALGVAVGTVRSRLFRARRMGDDPRTVRLARTDAADREYLALTEAGVGPEHVAALRQRVNILRSSSH